MSANEPTETKSKATSISLYNPNNIAALSLLFSPVFGAYLTAENQRALGQETERAGSLKWCLASILIILAGTFFLQEKAAALGFWLLVLWYLFSGKKHARWIKENIGDTYQKKSLLKPSVVAIACLAIFIIVIGLVTDSYVTPDESFLNSQLTTQTGGGGVEDQGITVGGFVKALGLMKMDNGKSPAIRGWTQDDNVYTLHVDMKKTIEIEFVHLLNQDGRVSLMKPIQTDEGEVPAMSLLVTVLSSLPQQPSAQVQTPIRQESTPAIVAAPSPAAAPAAPPVMEAPPAPSAMKEVTITGSLDSGTMLSNISADDGSTYSFPTDSEIANKIFSACSVNDKCQISAYVEDGEHIEQVFSAKKIQ